MANVHKDTVPINQGVLRRPLYIDLVTTVPNRRVPRKRSATRLVAINRVNSQTYVVCELLARKGIDSNRNYFVHRYSYDAKKVHGNRFQRSLLQCMTGSTAVHWDLNEKINYGVRNSR